MIGHVPLCAQHAAERYAEFPKQERMNSLRPYLAKYDLFPPRRDPQTVRPTTITTRSIPHHD